MSGKKQGLIMGAILALAALTAFLTLARCDRDRQVVGPGQAPTTQRKDRAPGQAEVRQSPQIGGGQTVAASYVTRCGACHGAYPPMLLPAASWEKILNQLDAHFGEKVALEPQGKAAILQYLRENGADRSTAKKAAKIMVSLGGQAPLRVTEVPYIQKKHRKISPDVFQRKAVGGLANCSACHRSAAQGHFSDKDVVIPQ